MDKVIKFKGIRLVVELIVYVLPLIANAADLIEGVDYNYGNGRGAPIAESVAKYAHKDTALDHFTRRKVKAIQLHSDYFEDLPNDLEKILKADYDVLSMDPIYASGSGEKVKFLTQSGLEKCQVFLINEKFYHYNNSGALILYSSGNAVLDGVTGDIIIMDLQGNIFIHPKEFGYIHHSSFFSQKPVAFAAMVRIKKGEIVHSNLTKDNLNRVTLFPTRVKGSDCMDGLFYYSGHYDPSTGSDQVKNRIKQDALDNFKKELTTKHFRSFNSVFGDGFVSIPGGTYEIGSPPDEKWHEKNERLHSVKLSPFSIKETVVTQEEYARLTGRNPSYYKEAIYDHCPGSLKKIVVKGVKIWVCPEHPVEMVSWDDANAFAQLMSKHDSKYNYSLPTEAQLEVAFRGGTKTAYPTGRDDDHGLRDYIWYHGTRPTKSSPVKSKLANAYGIYRSDTEWAKDYYDGGYAGSTGLDPQGPTSGDCRVVRGGSWGMDARFFRSADRSPHSPHERYKDLEFRLVRTQKS